MTAADLQRIGQALYGERWQTSLANAIKVSDRSVRYWSVGRPIPPGVERDITALVMAKARILTNIAKGR